MSGAQPPWPLSAILAFTPWVLVPSVAALVLAVLTRTRPAVAAALVVTVVLTAVVVPRAWGGQDSRDGAPLRVMTANLRIGGADAATVVELVRTNRVDLLAIQEFTSQARANLSRAGLDTLLAYHVDDAEPLAIGSALYARLPLTDGSFPVGAGGFVEATATLQLRDLPPLKVRSVHPCAPFTARHEECWLRGLDREPRASPKGLPSLLMGDFNATLDHPPLRRLIGSGYRDAADATGYGLVPTWPADLVPVATLDHVLVDSRIGVRAVSVHRLPGSDHRAVIAVLAVPR